MLLMTGSESIEDSSSNKVFRIQVQLACDNELLSA